ncbi:MAG: hypothetical protein GYB67_02510 [Chloroflexi bacterium]|nr:hypothetical protein [Chloroflexota bacterium]
MRGLSQIGIALGALGGMLTLMGLFPGITGIDPGVGVGVVQFATIVAGLTLLMSGALIYVKYTFYADRPATFSQQIGVRLTMTGCCSARSLGWPIFSALDRTCPASTAPIRSLGHCKRWGWSAGFCWRRWGCSCMPSWASRPTSHDPPGAVNVTVNNVWSFKICLRQIGASENAL